MNAKFQWFGFAVARKHVYFYFLLLVATFFANTIKTSLVGDNPADSGASREIAEVHQAIMEVQSDLASMQ